MFFVIFWIALVRYTWLSNSSRFFFRQSVLSDVFGLNGRHHWQLRAAAQRCGAGGCRREATWIWLYRYGIHNNSASKIDLWMSCHTPKWLVGMAYYGSHCWKTNFKGDEKSFGERLVAWWTSSMFGQQFLRWFPFTHSLNGSLLASFVLAWLWPRLLVAQPVRCSCYEWIWYEYLIIFVCSAYIHYLAWAMCTTWFFKMA